ncbi:MAG TPA: RNA polymerase sigma factor [Pyrinomonadaceae bacterium]|nr:RNA polymerase sigma factor [Pyrinomonadaceae bacterium]
MSNPPSDLDLLRLMRAGDEDAFVALYRRRQGGVYRFALQMCGSTAIAEDVTQEVFMALMQDACHFDPSRGSLAAYLYGIARNQVLRVLARDRAYVPMHDDADDAQPSATPDALIADCDVLGDLTRGETIERVRQAVLALPAHYREVVALCELQELSYAEAAAVSGCAVGTVRSRLHRARAMLIEKLRATAEVKEATTTTDSFRTARCFA